MDSNEEIELETREQMWANLLHMEGESRADTLSSLAIEYSGTEESPYSIALAEESMKIFKEIGFTGNEPEFIWIWGSIAESKAKLELYDEAIEAAIKCRTLCLEHVYPQYGMFKWELLKWYLEAGRISEAKKHFGDILEPYLWSYGSEDPTVPIYNSH